MVTHYIDIDIVPFVSTQQYSTLASVVIDLIFSLQPNEVEIVYHPNSSVDLVL